MMLTLAEQPNTPTTRPKRRKGYQDCVELQALLMNDARDPELKPIIRAGIARAYCELEETKRKLRMRPLPKSVDVSHNGKPLTKVKPQTTPTFSE